MVALTLGENDLITDISVSGFDSVQEKFSFPQQKYQNRVPSLHGKNIMKRIVCEKCLSEHTKFT